jgi:predicted hotdog family 3-hydroxylacyl-ACP dehydratase
VNSLDRAQIARCIPHAGTMVLLDEVLDWNDVEVVAQATSHRHQDNPLRGADGLHAACAIEYASQAMALHGHLRTARAGPDAPRARAGLLAAVRGVRFYERRLDTQSAPLVVRAQWQSGDARAALYRFEVSAAGRLLVEGRATVVFDAFRPDGASTAGAG